VQEICLSLLVIHLMSHESQQGALAIHKTRNSVQTEPGLLLCTSLLSLHCKFNGSRTVWRVRFRASGSSEACQSILYVCSCKHRLTSFDKREQFHKRPGYALCGMLTQPDSLPAFLPALVSLNSAFQSLAPHGLSHGTYQG